jgi:hypothetical protein
MRASPQIPTKGAIGSTELTMDQEKLKQFRRQSIEKALRAGLPAYFLDECDDDGVIRVKPNGAAERIVIQQGQVQVQPFECRAC